MSVHGKLYYYLAKTEIKIATFILSALKVVWQSWVKLCLTTVFVKFKLLLPYQQHLALNSLRRRY